MPTNNHFIFNYTSLQCKWSPCLPHLGKYWGSYACSNLGSPGNHSHALLKQGVVPGQRPIQIAITSSSHLRLRWSLSILESPCHELRIVYGLTLVRPYLHGWEAFPTPGVLIHTRITWAFSLTAPQILGVTSGPPLCPWCFGYSLWNGARHLLLTFCSRHKYDLAWYHQSTFYHSVCGVNMIWIGSIKSTSNIPPTAQSHFLTFRPRNKHDLPWYNGPHYLCLFLWDFFRLKPLCGEIAPKFFLGFNALAILKISAMFWRNFGDLFKASTTHFCNPI